MPWRTFVLAGLLFSLATAHALSWQWFADFWEHAAVVRELAAHPFAPRHPLFAIDAPHVFYSPYTLVLGLVARATGADPSIVLGVAGLANLLLLLAALRAFLATCLPGRPDCLMFYTLLLLLFWWGTNPWGYSGFMHIGIIGYVLPYPSAFAMGLALLVMARQPRNLARARPSSVGLLVLFSSLVLLCHPLTFVFLASGLLARAVASGEDLIGALAVSAIILAGAVVLGLSWPYFPLAQLLLGEQEVFHASNRALYENAHWRAWPLMLLLVALPFLRPPAASRGLVLALMALSGVYLYGALSASYAYGRMAAFIALLTFALVGERLHSLESWLRQHRSRLALAVPMLTIVLCLGLSRDVLERAISRVMPPWTGVLGAFEILKGRVPPDAVVMADLKTGWPVPALGGRIVASLHALAFVPDHERRRADVARFFDVRTPDAVRELLLDSYAVDFVLLSASDDVRMRKALDALAPVVVREAGNTGLVLYRVRHRDR